MTVTGYLRVLGVQGEVKHTWKLDDFQVVPGSFTAQDPTTGHQTQYDPFALGRFLPGEHSCRLNFRRGLRWWGPKEVRVVDTKEENGDLEFVFQTQFPATKVEKGSEPITTNDFSIHLIDGGTLEKEREDIRTGRSSALEFTAHPVEGVFWEDERRMLVWDRGYHPTHVDRPALLESARPVFVALLLGEFQAYPQDDTMPSLERLRFLADVLRQK